MSTELYAERFRKLHAQTNGSPPAWFASRRTQALERFCCQGFPTTRLEDWKYTNLAPLTKLPFELGQAGPDLFSRDDVEHIAYPLFACSVFVFANGHYLPDYSTPSLLSGSLPIRSLAQSLEQAPQELEPHLSQLEPEASAFAALNTAFMQDGAWLHVPKQADVTAPIHLVFVSAPGAAPSMSHPRTLIVAEAGSRATVIEDHVSLNGGVAFTNPVTEIVLGENAELQYIKLQRENQHTFHVSSLFVRQERDSRFTSHTMSFGSAITRNSVNALLAAEGAECTLNGLFVAGGDQHVDNHTTIDHAEPHGTSRELYKGILDGSARGIFNGKIVVRPGAQHTDAQQHNANLLMSEKAEIDTKPQLEIYADDVKCAHGSTVGHLEENALFYLRSRGLSEAAARDMLTSGFASEVTGTIPVEPLRDRVDELVLARLAQPQEAA